MQLSDAGKQEMYARISVGKSTTLVKSETHSEYAFQGNTTPTRTAHDALFEAKERVGIERDNALEKLQQWLRTSPESKPQLFAMPP